MTLTKYLNPKKWKQLFDEHIRVIAEELAEIRYYTKMQQDKEDGGRKDNPYRFETLLDEKEFFQNIVLGKKEKKFEKMKNRIQESISPYTPDTLSANMLPENEYSDLLRPDKRDLSRSAFLYDPFGKRQVTNETSSIAGLGFTITSPHPDINAIIEDFIFDDKNYWEMFTRTSLNTKSTDGELIWMLFIDKVTGRCIVRERPKSEFNAIYSKTDFRKVEKWIRQWDIVEFDPATGEPSTTMESNSVSIVSGKAPPTGMNPLGGSNVELQIIHVANPTLAGSPDGEGALNAILPTIQYMRKIFKYRATRMILAAAYTWFLKFKNKTTAQLAVEKQKLTDFPRPGNFVMESENCEWEAKGMQLGGQDATPEIREYKLMAGPVNSGQTEFMTTGDASNSNYSSTNQAQGSWFNQNDDNRQVFRYHLMRLIAMVVRAGSQYNPKYKNVVDENSKVKYDPKKFNMPKRTTGDLIPLKKLISIRFPKIPAIDRLKEANSYKVLNDMGVKSKATIADELGLDWEIEKAQIEEELEFTKKINDILGISNKNPGDMQDDGAGEVGTDET